MDRETALRLLSDDELLGYIGWDHELERPAWDQGVRIDATLTADQLRALLWFHDEEGAK